MLQPNNIYLGDCLELMKQIPDKYIDVCLCDPPYGIHDKITAKGQPLNAGNKFARLYDEIQWDKKRPQKIYFDEIIRISKNQIICGGNYFCDSLPISRGWVFWDKMGEGVSVVNNELIYTSFDVSIKTFQRCHGLDKGFMVKDGSAGLHPTQKPVALIKWLVKTFTNENDLILDPFLGSGTTAIACYDLKRRYIGIEKEPRYFEIAKKRIEQFKAQGRLF